MRRAPPERRASRAPVRSRTSSTRDRKSTRLNSSHRTISYAVFCLKKKKAATHSAGGTSDIIGGTNRCTGRTGQITDERARLGRLSPERAPSRAGVRQQRTLHVLRV